MMRAPKPSFPPFYSTFFNDGGFFNTVSGADMTKDEKSSFVGGRDEEKVKVFPSPFRRKEGGQSFFLASMMMMPSSKCVIPGKEILDN